MKIAYINENQERLYDSYMLRERLRVSKSKLQKLFEQYNFNSNDYLIHQNKFLYTEESIVNFIEAIVMKKHLIQTKQVGQKKLETIRDRIKNFMRNNEPYEN